MIFSSIPSLADSFRKPWPVVRTENIYDYTQADAYDTQYVWLVDKYAKLERDFSLSWLPDDNEKDMCHVFKKVNSAGYEVHPIAVLVPTNRNRRIQQRHQTRPAQVERNIYDIYVKIDRTTESRERYKKFTNRWNRVAPLIINDEKAMCKSVMRTLSTKYAWIIEPEQEFEDDWNFGFSPTAMNAIYLKPKIFIMPNGVRLYPDKYFMATDETEIDTVTIDPQ
jgi:hypothetical protein